MELHRARVYGIWVSLKEADYIAYEKHTSVAHQSHIIAHELSHILCDHRAGGQGDSGLAELFPNLDPDLVQGMLLRCGYTQDAEQEAEIMASLLLLRAQHRTTELSWGPPPEDVETLARIEGVIGLGTLDEAKEGEPSPPRDGGIAR
ncbi:hypothetical protein [Streptomyces sp. NBC_00690]|uniref:hypothetical protein n=1 Tax=Streptomyces sp. NBC_00690 TaxID=2975808 RepID=UPI002E2BAEA0|nr:hypothetical protein [Streptomyces sp. NBC_00690]